MVYMHDILTPDECSALIAKSEDKGFEVALLNVGGGRQVLAHDVRNSFRCIVDDDKFARVLYDRIKATLKHHNMKIPAITISNTDDESDKWTPVGLNERMRILKYDEGMYFSPHFDGSFERPNGIERSMFTCQLYPNGGECFQGGNTNFLNPHSSVETDKEISVVPRAGSIVLFHHRLLHEGAKLNAALLPDVYFGILVDRSDEADVWADAEVADFLIVTLKRAQTVACIYLC
jgi:hypothetical protein